MAHTQLKLRAVYSPAHIFEGGVRGNNETIYSTFTMKYQIWDESNFIQAKVHTRQEFVQVQRTSEVRCT
jgi:hypothetical protein